MRYFVTYCPRSAIRGCGRGNECAPPSCGEICSYAAARLLCAGYNRRSRLMGSWDTRAVQRCLLSIHIKRHSLQNSGGGGGNNVIGDMNYLFYFPLENTVLSFIDPRLPRVYPKGVLHGKYGIVVNFQYGGGFPPGFAGLGAQDVLGGNITYPVPGDRWGRVVVSTWPFIKRSSTVFDYPKHCRFNKDCFCIRKS